MLKTCLLILILLSHATAIKAEDFCDTKEIMSATHDDQQMEARVREKCKVGDVILLYKFYIIENTSMVARLCDFNKAVDSNACILAPQRRVY